MKPWKPASRWLVACSCGWTDRLPAHKMAEQAAALHQRGAAERTLHAISIGATRKPVPRAAPAV